MMRALGWDMFKLRKDVGNVSEHGQVDCVVDVILFEGEAQVEASSICCMEEGNAVNDEPCNGEDFCCAGLEEARGSSGRSGNVGCIG
mmetsp:Transcript_33848/g.101009  ORF Transcript_33848/g.101009 Transcript_33848/m.101009 type:complete len:87 (-) Transcript_33848:344-604(-)